MRKFSMLFGLVVLSGCMVASPGGTVHSHAGSGGSAAGSGGSGSGGAAGGGCPGNQVTAYDDEHQQGQSVSLPPGRYDVAQFDQTPVPNDSIRSLCVPAGCTVVLYADGGFSGEAHTYTSTTHSLGAFNGSASGAVVTCVGR
jgi:hypothetical protein